MQHESQDGDVSVDLLFEKCVSDYLDQQFPDYWRLRNQPNVSFHVTTRQLPYTLLVVDNPDPAVCLLTYGPSNGVEGALVCTPDRSLE